MHELSLAQEIVAIATRAAADNGARRVLAIELEVGELAGADPETLGFALEIAGRGTPAEGCTVRCRRTPLAGRCRCGWEGKLTLEEPHCPRCGATGLTVTAGRELRVITIEAEDADE